MEFQCAHRWVFSSWGGTPAEQEDALASAVGHEVTIRVTHCGMCHSDLHLQAGGFGMGGGRWRRSIGRWTISRMAAWWAG